MEEKALKEQASKIVEQLTLVKNEFIKNKEELAVSIRKDVVATELKNIISESTDYNALISSLNGYINELLKEK